MHARFCRREGTVAGGDGVVTAGLDAQREAAQAYIASQKSEGWVGSPQRYDDGGYTGANMDRPALARLIDDIHSGEVDCVVVYKVDRLSRSLLDFARIMGIFQEHGVAFVSVTQQFNTATPMGRLTLNVLFSFAQFERELIAERTRDKMAAARRRGKYIGGAPVLGYDLANGRLVVNPEEARRVQALFELYLEKRSLPTTLRELDRRRWRTKCWTTRRGNERGGRPFRRNNLHFLLTNVAYLGKVRFENRLYKAEHEAILPEKLFGRVQALIERKRRCRRERHPQRSSRPPALLSGLLHCGNCRCPMVLTSTQKGPRRYRYYVCRSAQQEGWHTCPAPSLPAADVEAFVVAEIQKITGQKDCTDTARWALENFDLVRRRVARVEYDGRAGEIAVTLQEGVQTQ